MRRVCYTVATTCPDTRYIHVLAPFQDSLHEIVTQNGIDLYIDIKLQLRFVYRKLSSVLFLKDGKPSSSR
jgi:hypothetical protein